MRRGSLLFLIAALFWSVTALAQNVTVIGPVTPGDLASFNSPTVIKDSGISGSGGIFTVQGLVINPTAASNNQGLVITQTTPNTGTVTGPITLNGITVIDNSQTVSGGFPQDQWGQITNQTDVFRINYKVTGGPSNHFGLNVATQVTGTNGGTVPLISGCYVNVGPITGDCWVNLAVGTIGPSGNLQQNIFGYEAEMAIADTGVGLGRIGFSALSQGPTAGTNFDAAYMVAVNHLGATNYLTAVPWQEGIWFSKDLYSANTFPVATSGDIIKADTGTVANFISAHTLTVTGNVIDLPFVQITGPGTAIFGNGSSATSNVIQVKCSTCGTAEFTISANGTAGASSVFMSDSSTNNILVASAFEGSNTTTRFGQTAGHWVQYTSAGSTNLGMLVGTQTAEPMIFGTNNLNRMEIFSSGCVSIGNTTDCSAPGIVNLLTGIRIGNAATSGNVLRGNGTNFVSAQLACSDLSGVGSGCSAAAGITALTGDVTASGSGSVAATLATAQPAVHTWALAQTFTVAPGI